jgi:hypothetical protein
MFRFFAQSVLTLLGNALGLVTAALLLADFHLSGLGFFMSVLFFTIAYILLSPFVLKMALKYAPAFRGGIALIATLLVLILTSIFTDGLRINGIGTWVAASLVIWLITVIAGIVLPIFIFKKTLASSRRTQKARDQATTLTSKK